MSSLINHTYEDVAGQVTLTASSNANLGIDVSFANLKVTDHTSGGIWKLNETFNTDLVSPDGNVISTEAGKTSELIFNKFVTGTGSQIANAIFPNLTATEKGKYTTLFGGTTNQTVFKIWYNQSCPLINIICFDPNTINTSKLIAPQNQDIPNITQYVSIGLFGYPVIAFKSIQVGVASRTFNRDNITDLSINKLIDLKTCDDLEFTGTWYDEPFETVTASKWASDVRSYVSILNRNLLSEDKKMSSQYVMSANNKYQDGSLTYRLIANQITNLDSIFFQIA